MHHCHDGTARQVAGEQGMKKKLLLLFPIGLIVALYFVTRFVMDAIIEIEDDQWGEDV